MSCLAAHASDFRPTASTCITAAQDHYDAASSLQGQEADLELGMASTDLLAAAVANVYLFHFDLATSQVHATNSMLSRILKDPEAGGLAQGAKLGLAQAKLVQKVIDSLR